jgi:MFS family permease
VLGVLIATTWSTTAALVAVGVATVGAGALLMWFDPPTRTVTPTAGSTGTERVPATSAATATPAGAATGDDSRSRGLAGRARVVTPALLVTLLASSAASLVLTGTDVSIVASLQAWDRAPDTGWMIALWAAGSLVGGLVYGAGRRSVQPLTLVLVLAVLTVPAALAGNPLWLAVAVVLAGVPCAPALSSITATLVRLVPEHRRGEVMGWSGSAMTVGSALGAPLCGLVIDRAGAPAGFLVAGGVGVVVAGGGLLVLAVVRDRRRAAATPDEAAATLEPDVVGAGSQLT